MGMVNPGHTIAIFLTRTLLLGGIQYVYVLVTRMHFVICFLKTCGVIRIDGSWEAICAEVTK